MAESVLHGEGYRGGEALAECVEGDEEEGYKSHNAVIGSLCGVYK